MPTESGWPHVMQTSPKTHQRLHDLIGASLFEECEVLISF